MFIKNKEKIHMPTLNFKNNIVFLSLVIATVIGCEHVITIDDPPVDISDDDDTAVVPGDDDDSVVPNGILTGIVIDAYGQSLANVVVSVLGSDVTAETDASGRFKLENLEVSARTIVNFRKPAYARASTPVEIQDGVENNVIQRMAVVDHVFDFNASDGHVFTDEKFKLELPSSNVVDSDGNNYDGSVVVEITIFDLVSDFNGGNELLATPGDFTAVDAAGEDKVLESFGMVQVNLTTPSGLDLQLGNTAAPIRLPVQNLEEPPQVGDEIAAWSYNETTGKWVEEAIGTVVEFEGDLVWEFQAPHFSTWNCDRPISTHGCLTGNVTDSQGNPRGGATVRAVGITYISTTTARTNQDGSFCLEVKNGETVWAEISYSIAGQTATQRTDPVVIPAGQASCSLGESTCTDLGDIPVDIQTCISGIVVDSQLAPMAGVQVLSTAAGLATSASDGSFCLTTPVFSDSAIFAVTEPGDVLYKPVRVFTQPSLPDCQTGCANQVIVRPYGSTSCVRGGVVVNGELASNLPVDIYDLNFPEVRVGSVITSTNGSYCATVPVSAPVAVQIGNDNAMCASKTIDYDLAAGSACGDNGQSAECYTLNQLECNF